MRRKIRLMQGIFCREINLSKLPPVNRVIELCRNLRARSLNRIARLLKKPVTPLSDGARLPIFFVIAGYIAVRKGYQTDSATVIFKMSEELKNNLIIRRIPYIDKTSIAEFCREYRN